MEDWAEIRRLHKAEGLGVKTIARRLGVARNTVRSVLRPDAPPKYERSPQGSIVDVVGPEIHELLRDTTDIPATVIAERIGWERRMTVLRDRIGDADIGLKAAISKKLIRATWQGCRIHHARKPSRSCPRRTRRMAAVTERTLFARPGAEPARSQRRMVSDSLRKRNPSVSDVLDTTDLIAYPAYPRAHWRKMLVPKPRWSRTD